ncbi:hypothetical protein E2320_020126, partial [Naja naja]
KTSSGGILKDQSKVQLNPSNTSRVKFSTKTYVQPLRSREPQDISKVFEEEITPGFTLSHSKEHIDVTLGEEFFEKQKPTEEPIKTTISELTAIIEQLRRDHQVTHKQMEKDMEEKCNEMQEEHDNKMRDIQGFHIIQVNNLEEQYKKQLRNERATAQEKLATMQKEYKYLKNTFRMYQDSISDEMEEKWLRRQAEWKKSERTEREKALLQQKRYEMELEEQKKIIQNNSFLLGRVYEQEREEFQKQQQIALENIEALNAKIKACTLENELNEKNETLNAIASSLHKTELELQKEKAKMADMERSIQQKAVAAEEKYRINIASLSEENNILRWGKKSSKIQNTTMQKEYKYLKNTFRMYQDSISDEMEEKWLRRQANGKKEFQKQQQIALENIEALNAKIKACTLENELNEKNETLNAIASSLHKTELELQKEVALHFLLIILQIAQNRVILHLHVSSNIGSFPVTYPNIITLQFQSSFILEDSKPLVSPAALGMEYSDITALPRIAKKKKDFIDDRNMYVTSHFSKTQFVFSTTESQNGRHGEIYPTKAVAAEEKYRINIASLSEENNILRRKLIEKNEEIFNERAQKSSIFGLFD